MTFATNMAAVAARLCSQYGESVSFARVVEGAYVPSTGAVGSGTSSSYTANGVPTQYNQQEIDGVLVQINDVKLICEEPTSIPDIGDVATIGSKAYRVISVNKISVQGDVVLYILQCRI